MARINRVEKVPLSLNNKELVTTKRQYMDTNERLIMERLKQIHRQTIADCYVKGKLNNIKNFTYEGAFHKQVD